MLWPNAVMKLMLPEEVGPTSRTRSDSSPRMRSSILPHALELRGTRSADAAPPPDFSFPPKKLTMCSDSLPCSGAGDRRCGGRGAGDLNLALHTGVLFNGKTTGVDVTLQYGGITEFQPPCGTDVTVESSINNNVSGIQISLYLGIWPKRETVIRQADGAFEVAINVELFAARD